MPGSLRIILGEQLSPGISCLDGYDHQYDTVLMIEALEDISNVFYHKKKIAFLLSSMRHFSCHLTTNGYNVTYIKLDDPENTGSFKTEVERAIAKYSSDRIICTFTSEYSLLTEMRSWESRFGLPVEIRDNNQYLFSPKQFEKWTEGRKEIRKRDFYQVVRKKICALGINQYSDCMGSSLGHEADIKPDKITQSVLKLVEDRFGSHFGSLYPFDFAVNHADAQLVLSKFIDYRLQDCETQPEQDVTYRSHIAFYLNSGLLQPADIAAALNAAEHAGQITTEVAGRFIDQIIGRREFMRGLYWQKSKKNINENFLGAERKLPAFYLNAETDLNCIKQCVSQSQQSGYIDAKQQLMILANFALLTGVNPNEIIEWQRWALVDTNEWVELLDIEDTGISYVSGGTYIAKSFNYCDGCRYNVKQKHGDDACPFNYLYWNFFIDNKKKLEFAPQLAFYYRTLSGMTISRLIEYSMEAHRFMKLM